MPEGHFLIHPDGYVAFRIEATADGPVMRIRDDAIAGPAALTDPRHLETRSVDDGFWIRLIDVERSLAARTYGVEIDAVVEVVDP